MLKPVSEKAKGKQRADPIPEGVPEDGGSTQRELMIRFTEGVQDLILHLTPHDSVNDVKIKVRPRQSCVYASLSNHQES